MGNQIGNIFAKLPRGLSAEQFDTLAVVGARVERIISTGQATPEGEWLDQDWDEWVILLAGQAGLRLEGEGQELTLAPGDYMLIPAHRRHRVEWTSKEEVTVWLAVHGPAQ